VDLAIITNLTLYVRTHEDGTVSGGLVTLVKSTIVDRNDCCNGSVTDCHQGFTTCQHWLSTKLIT
jgi:hypothetical protein